VTSSQSETLQTVVNEFATLSQDTIRTFIFDKDGETIAKSRDISEDQTKVAIDNFSNLKLQTEMIGCLESVTIRGVQGQLCISKIGDLQSGTVSLENADPRIINSLSCVLMPIIVELLEQKRVETAEVLEEPKPLEEEKSESLETIAEEEVTQEAATETIEEAETLEDSTPLEEEVSEYEEDSIQEESTDEEESESVKGSELSFVEQPKNQLMIERIKGILVPADTVRIDKDLISNWIELYGDRSLLINIETLEGRTATCKFKPIKDTKSNSKGVIMIPDKLLQALEADQGQLVVVKPEVA
jgi:hypothetical protein